MKSYKINTSFVSHRIRGNDPIHDFSVWTRSVTHLADINRFRTILENRIKCMKLGMHLIYKKNLKASLSPYQLKSTIIFRSINIYTFFCLNYKVLFSSSQGPKNGLRNFVHKTQYR